MKKIEIETYLFEELSEESKKKAIEKVQQNSDSWVFDNWYEFIIEDFKSMMLNHGIVVGEVFFSGFYGQGDGASFNGSVNIEDYINNSTIKEFKPFIEFNNQYGFNIVIGCNNSHYCHANTMFIESDIRESEIKEFQKELKLKDVTNENYLFDVSETLEDNILGFCKDQANKLYKELQEEYEYLLSDDYISQQLIDNEVYFLENGSTIFYL